MIKHARLHSKPLFLFAIKSNASKLQKALSQIESPRPHKFGSIVLNLGKCSADAQLRNKCK